MCIRALVLFVGTRCSRARFLTSYPKGKENALVGTYVNQIDIDHAAIVGGDPPPPLGGSGFVSKKM